MAEVSRLPAPSARIDGLDAWRALLMLGGILTHGTILREADPVFEAIGLVSASFRVGAFFMLSGLLSGFALERRPPAAWLRSRLVRIGVPTIFGLTVVCPSTSLVLMETLDPAAADDVLLCDWYHLWFLVALLLYTVMLVPVIRIDRRLGLFAALSRRYAVTRSIQLPLLLAVGSLSLLLMVATTELISAFCDEHYQPMMVQTRLIVGYAPLYLLGFVLGRSAELRQAALGRKGPALAILAGLALLEAAWLGGWLDRLTAANRESCGTLITLLGAAFGPPAAFVLIWRSSLSIRQVPDRLKRLADASFTIYIIHFPLIVGINLALMHVDWNIYAEYAIAVGTSAALSYGLHRLVIRRSDILSFLFNGRPSPCRSQAAIGPALRSSRVAA